MPNVLIIGPPGVGKSSVLTALHDLLVDQGVEHALAEVEALAWSHPPLSDEQAFRHLHDVARGYAAAGRELLVCAATPTSQGYLDDLLATLDAGSRFVVRLEARPETLQRRIVEREPPGWSGLDCLLKASRSLAAMAESLDGIDLVLSTEETTPSAVAERLYSGRPDIWVTANDRRRS